MISLSSRSMTRRLYWVASSFWMTITISTPSLSSGRSGDNSDEPIYHVGKDDTKAPRATYAPEPEFSDQARRAKFQGVVYLSIVVDKTGNISRIRLEKALGMGLDENAMQGVKKWRFNPATHNGQPAAVEMTIEVAFNLY